MPPRKLASELLIGPTGELVAYLAEEMIFASLTERGIHTLAVLPNLIATAKSFAELVDQNSSAIHWELVSEQIAGIDDLAREEEKTDFARLRAHSSVAMWSVLESSIDDLTFNLSTLFTEKVSSSSTTRAGEDDALPEHTRRAFDRWRSKIVGRASNVVDQQLLILSNLGVSCQLDEKFLPVLIELSEARNIIVHHRSLVDARFLKRCPHLAASLGDRYVIDREKYLSFYDAVGAYAQALLQACTDVVLSGTFEQD